MKVIATCCAVITIANLGLATVTARRIILAQEWIVARTDVLQTAIVQFDVIVGTDKYATTCCACPVLKVLQIHIVSFFFTTAEPHLR